MTSLSPTIDTIIPGRVLPVIDIDNAAFFEAAARGALIIQRCRDTGLHQYYPRPASIHTMGEVEWVTVEGKGTVYSFTIIRKNPADPVFAKQVPYAIALIELPEGVRIMGNITGCEIEDIHIGLAVQVYFRPVDEAGAIHLPFWKPAA